jgi:predicted amidohydrolase
MKTLRGPRRPVLFVFALVVLAGITPALPAEDLTTVLVQFDVDPVDYRSLRAFRARIAELIVEAKERYNAEFVVFPEYVSTFALFTDVIDRTGEIETEDLPPEVRTVLADPEPRDGDLDEVHAFVAAAAERESERIVSLWRGLARRHGVWILAGSGFVPADGEEGVHNRLWVIDTEGDVVYEQDKVFLTEYEREILGVVPGEVEEAHPFEVEDVELSVTICRDSYFEAWEEPFNSVDGWIDVRANGEVWDESVRRRFDTALPERIARTDVEIGVSTSLNGRFLGLLWQGPAFVVGPDGERVRQSPVIDGDFLMAVELDGS